MALAAAHGPAALLPPAWRLLLAALAAHAVHTHTWNGYMLFVVCAHMRTVLMPRAAACLSVSSTICAPERSPAQRRHTNRWRDSENGQCSGAFAPACCCCCMLAHCRLLLLLLLLLLLDAAAETTAAAVTRPQPRSCNTGTHRQSLRAATPWLPPPARTR
jgi:hypothetical protein